MNEPPGIRGEQALEQGFQLSELRIDPRAGEVSGPGGREQLDPKVMDALVVMAEHAGQVVSREQLHKRLWPSAIVTDDALTRCLYVLRGQLSRAGGSDRYKAMLETLPKRGYRLNGTVTAITPAADDGSPVRTRRRIPTSVIGMTAAVLVAIFAGLYLAWFHDEAAPPATTASRDSIAVLPFIDMSEHKDQGYFSDGVTEEILNRLSQAKGLRVISRTSSFVFRNETLDVPEIAARLDVRYVLEGSVRKSGDRVRITAQLIDASTNAHVWSETIDRGIGDLFAIQDEIAHSVASALQVTLAGDAPHAGMPASAEAYERFLQGEFFYHRRATDDIERAVKYYLEAVDLEQHYARAWAALAGAYALLEMRDQQGQAASKAVELDPGLAVARARMAQFYYQTRQRKKGDEHWRAALALDPDDPLVMGYSASRAVSRGDIKEAVAMWRQLAARDPLSATSRGNLGAMLLADGQFDEAVSALRESLEVNPDNLDEQLKLISGLALLERYDEVEAAVARLPEGAMRDFGLALLYRVPGHRADADAALKRLAAQPFDARGDGIQLAEVYAFRAMDEKALALLQETRTALERRQPQEPDPVWNFIEELRLSPFLRPLHTDPRWAALLTEPGG